MTFRHPMNAAACWRWPEQRPSKWPMCERRSLPSAPIMASPTPEGQRYRQGEFDFIGVRAAVELPIPYGKDRSLSRIESPGLWGIESDSGEDYLESVFQEESNILADMLAELGVTVQ
jgi:hypothetical protein